MKRNAIAKFIACALAFGLSGTAMAGPQFYAAINYGESTTSGDNTINYALFDSANTGDYSPLGTEYGNGEIAGLQLGLRFDNKMFIELSGSRIESPPVL